MIGGNDPAPAGQNEDGSLSYDVSTDVIAHGGKWIIPLFWFSIFDHSNLTVYSSGEIETPTVVCSKPQALATMQRRGPLISAWFGAASPFWAAWQQRITDAPFPYFKLDVTEIWDLDPDLFGHDFPMALRSLSSHDPEDFERLLQFCGIQREADGVTFSAAGSPFTESFVIGL